jgi:hypothetical protein
MLFGYGRSNSFSPEEGLTLLTLFFIFTIPQVIRSWTAIARTLTSESICIFKGDSTLTYSNVLFYSPQENISAPKNFLTAILCL